MTDEKDLKGYRIWEIDEKTNVPKVFRKGTLDEFFCNDLDIENKTYTIRIGKKGLK